MDLPYLFDVVNFQTYTYALLGLFPCVNYFSLLILSLWTLYIFGFVITVTLPLSDSTSPSIQTRQFSGYVDALYCSCLANTLLYFSGYANALYFSFCASILYLSGYTNTFNFSGYANFLNFSVPPTPSIPILTLALTPPLPRPPAPPSSCRRSASAPSGSWRGPSRSSSPAPRAGGSTAPSSGRLGSSSSAPDGDTCPMSSASCASRTTRR